MRFRKIFVSSAQRTHGTPTNFKIDLAEDQDCTGECYVACRNISMPNVFFSVLAGVNSKLHYFESDTGGSSQNVTIEVPEGQYTNSQLAAQLQTLMNAAAISGRTYSVPYNPVTQRITFLCTGGNFSIYDDATLKKLGKRDPSSGFFNFTNITPNPQSLQQLLNLPPETTPSNTLQTGVVAVARILEAYIRSPTLGDGTLDSGGKRDSLARVIIDKDFGEIVTSRGGTEVADYMNVSNRVLRHLEFTVTDQYGNLLNLHGIDWSMELAFNFGPLE